MTKQYRVGALVLPLQAIKDNVNALSVSEMADIILQFNEDVIQDTDIAFNGDKFRSGKYVAITGAGEVLNLDRIDTEDKRYPFLLDNNVWYSEDGYFEKTEPRYTRDLKAMRLK